MHSNSLRLAKKTEEDVAKLNCGRIADICSSHDRRPFYPQITQTKTFSNSSQMIQRNECSA